MTCAAVSRPANQLSPRIGLARKGVSAGVALAATHVRTITSITSGIRNAIAYGRMYFFHGIDQSQSSVCELFMNTHAINPAHDVVTNTAAMIVIANAVCGSHHSVTNSAAAKNTTPAATIVASRITASIRRVGSSFFASSRLKRKIRSYSGTMPMTAIALSLLNSPDSVSSINPISHGSFHNP